MTFRKHSEKSIKNQKEIMSLIKSISGIRGTIGGREGDGLSPVDIVKFTAAYAAFIRKSTTVDTNKIVVAPAPCTAP